MSCPDCFKGSVHNHAAPRGTMTLHHGYQTYITKPDSSSTKTSNSTILFLPDAFSLKLLNSKLLADRYASSTGCTVLIPDIIPGGGITPSILPVMDTIFRPAGFNPFAWLNKILSVFRAVFAFVPFMMKASPDKVYPEVLKYTRAVKNDLVSANKNGKLGVCGFCWGGFSSTKLCGEALSPSEPKTPLIDAQFNAHPSALKAPDMVVDALKVFKTPYSCAVAEEDFQFSAKVAAETEAAVRKAVGTPEEANYEFVVHKGCKHGFAVRANPDIKVEAQGLEDAAVQATNWFNRFLN